MGVLGLWEVLESVGHPVKVEGLEGKVLGVDANIWLYKFIRGFRDKDNATNIESHKLGLFNRISKLLFYRIKPVFVFDGPAPVLKRRTLERRQNLRSKTLVKVQDAAMRALANQLKCQYPGANIDQLRIKLPELRSNNLVAAEKLGEEDFNLFYLPPQNEIKKDNDNEIDSDSDYDDRVGSIQDSNKVDVDSKEFQELPPEIRYEILQDIKAKRRRLRHMTLPDDANSFSNLQLERLKNRRGIQQKIEECEKEICTNYTGELADGKIIQAYRVQSDATATILYRNSSQPIGYNSLLHDGPDKKPMTSNSDGRNAAESFKQERSFKSDESKDYSGKDTYKHVDSHITGQTSSSSFSKDYSFELTDESPNYVGMISSSDQSDSSTPESDDDETEVSQQPQKERARSPTPKSSSPLNESEASDFETDVTVVANAKTEGPTSGPNGTIILSSDEEADDDESLEVISPQARQTAPPKYASDLGSQANPIHLISPEKPDSPKTDHDTSQPSAEQSPKTKQHEQSHQDLKHQPSPAKLSQPKKQPQNESTQHSQKTELPLQDQRQQQEVSQRQRSEPTDRPSQAPLVYESSQMSSQNEHVANAQRATNKVTNKIVEDAKELLRLFGIPYMDAAGEAEAQCAKLEELKLTMGTITDDSDIWLFGSQNVYRYFFSDDKYVMQYKMPDIEYHIRMTRENLVCFAMLVGSDYTDGIMNVGPVTALEILSEFPGEGLEPLVKFTEWHRAASADKKLIGEKKRKKLLKYNIPDEFPSRAVYEGYMKPVADSSEEQFSWGTPELDELREYARRNFGWDQKRADEKLLPVMKKLNEKIQKTIDTFFFKTQANRNPEMFRSKRVNQALNKIAKRAALEAPPEVVNLSEDEDS